MRLPNEETVFLRKKLPYFIAAHMPLPFLLCFHQNLFRKGEQKYEEENNGIRDGSDDGGSFDDGLRAECGNRRK